jgi:hypothetical protein
MPEVMGEEESDVRSGISCVEVMKSLGQFIWDFSQFRVEGDSEFVNSSPGPCSHRLFPGGRKP